MIMKNSRFFYLFIRFNIIFFLGSCGDLGFGVGCGFGVGWGFGGWF